MSSKPNIPLEETQKLNADIKKANAAMSNWGEHNYQDQFPFGAGSFEHKEIIDKNKDRTAPTVEHEYKGFTLKPGNEETYYKWTIHADGFPLPKALSGVWNTLIDAEKAIDEYWKQEERRNEGNQV